jgi:hypothetical protein
MGKKEKAKYVYISYAPTDQETVDWLNKSLGDMVRFWFDSDRDLLTGWLWSGENERAIRHSQAVILLVTPDFLKSPLTNLEAGIALRHGLERPELPVIPVLMKGVTPDSLPPLLRGREAIDASRMTRDELVENLRKVISGTTSDGAG